MGCTRTTGTGLTDGMRAIQMLAHTQRRYCQARHTVEGTYGPTPRRWGLSDQRLQTVLVTAGDRRAKKDQGIRQRGVSWGIREPHGGAAAHPRGGADHVRREGAACPRQLCPCVSPSSTNAPFIVTHASRSVPATIFLISAAHPIERRTEERQNRKL